MSEENSKSKQDKYYTILSILLPVLNVAGIALEMLLFGYCSVGDFITAAAFTLCFDFIMLFYISQIKDRLTGSVLVVVIAALAPCLCFVTLHSGYPLLCFVIIVLFTYLFAGIADINTAVLLLMGSMSYCAIMLPEFFVVFLFEFIYIFLTCVFIKKAEDINSLICLCASSVLTYFILELIAANFVIGNIFTATKILQIVISVIFMVGVYFIRTNYKTEEEPEPVPAEPEPVKPLTKHEQKQLDRQYNSMNNKIENLKKENLKLSEQVTELCETLETQKTEDNRILDNYRKSCAVTLETMCSPKFDYVRKLKNDSLKLYNHCCEIAKLASESSELIGCDTSFAKSIGLYHEASKLLGDNYAEVLKKQYYIPDYVIRQIVMIKDKNNTKPISREACIVSLCDDIVNTINYLKKQGEVVSTERIVTNTIKVRRDQNLLKLAGFSNEELQLVKLYFTNYGGNNDSSD